MAAQQSNIKREKKQPPASKGKGASFTQAKVQASRWSALKGKVAEKLALWYFIGTGHHAHGCNVYTRFGEVDLVVSKNTTVVLVEVKFRPNPSRAHVAIHPKQKERLVLQAEQFQKNFPGKTIRFDAFFVYPKWPFFEHIKGAWESK